MNVLSLFDGMSCGQIALNRLGIEYDNYYASEIDKWAIKITQKNYPQTIQVGDICNIGGSDFPEIDLLIGGSPCQGFSTAGAGLNFEDSRSKLFFEYVRLLEDVKPKWFFLENVKMKKEWQRIISSCLGVEPILINSSLVSAQNRERLYWTNIPNVTQPEDRQIYLADVVESGVVDRDKSYCIDAHYSQGGNLKSYFQRSRRQLIFELPSHDNNIQAVARIVGRYLINGKRQDSKQKTAGLTKQYIEFIYDGKSNALSTAQKDNIVVPYTLEDRVLANEFIYRILTPLECERLQTVPEGYTEGVSKTQRYRMLGNGWTVDVIAHILKGITL